MSQSGNEATSFALSSPQHALTELFFMYFMISLACSFFLIVTITGEIFLFALRGAENFILLTIR